MRKLLFYIILILLAENTLAQELNCKVTVNAAPVQTQDRAVFKDMERAIAQFMNTRKWTQDTYKNHEKINCSLFITLNNMPSYGNFEGSAQLTSSRPVYGTNYETRLINYADLDFNFQYQESQPMEYNDNSYISNLTSILAFYAYFVLTMDYDSFAELGGSPYLQKAYQVVNNAQNSGVTGWVLGAARNRYNLMESLNNPQNLDWRKGTYQYHRLALDVFDKTPDVSRTKISEVLTGYKKIFAVNPGTVLLVLFFDAKSNEIVNIFTHADLNTRREVYDLVTSMDSKRTIFQQLVGN